MNGLEWLIEAFECDPEALRDQRRLERLFETIVQGMDLHPLGEPLWHRFEGAGGVTGLRLLAESHLAVHTFPEHRSLTVDLFCCRPRPDWDFANCLTREFGAARVSVRKMERPYGGAP